MKILEEGIGNSLLKVVHYPYEGEVYPGLVGISAKGEIYVYIDEWMLVEVEKEWEDVYNKEGEMIGQVNSCTGGFVDYRIQ